MLRFHKHILEVVEDEDNGVKVERGVDGRGVEDKNYRIPTPLSQKKILFY